jgi:RHS repeat-associated protein
VRVPSLALPPGESQGEGLTGADLSHRYLWQPGVIDQLMADERTYLDNGGIVTDEVLWALTDQQGTVHDLAKLDAATGATAVVNHIIRDSFGKVVSETDPSQGSLIGWTGRPVDKATGQQNNLNRWYDPIIAGWMSQDPSGFYGGQTNIYVYCGNSPTNGTDPTGQYFYWTDTRVFVYVTWTDATGAKHQASGEGPSFIRAILGRIQADGGVIDTLTLKGHGSYDGGGYNNTFMVTDGWVMTGGIVDRWGNAEQVDIADSLKKLTNGNSTIILNGCFTRATAKELAKILGNGAAVTGKTGPSISIPGTYRSAGFWWTYKYVSKDQK